VGLLVAAFISIFDPLHSFIAQYLSGILGYIAVLFVGILTYVCSTASVPMADALAQNGMSFGQALCYLIAGPVTSYSAILVIKKDFGSKMMAVYLFIICIFSPSQ